MKIANDSALLDFVPETLGRAKAGEHRILSRNEKKLAFHERLKAARRLPGNCGRCGKASATRTCSRCRTYAKSHKASKGIKAVVVNVLVLDALTRRVASLEHEIARMVVDHRARYKSGYRAGQSHECKARFAEMPYLSRQEAANINHAYRSKKNC